MLFAYIGPESVAPLTSALAAVAGAVLIFWRWIKSGIRKAVRFVFRLPAPEPEVPTEES